MEGTGIQRLYLLLSPSERELHRRIVVGRKRMPIRGGREREWAYVDRVAEERRDLVVDLGPSTYETKTRGTRHQPGGRRVAEGEYRLLEHGDHVHLAYVLDPAGPNHDPDLLGALCIEADDSIIVAVFNPLAKWSRAATLRYGGDPDEQTPMREPSIFSDEVQARFGNRRFAPLAPDMLDVEGAELVLIGGEPARAEELASSAETDHP